MLPLPEEKVRGSNPLSSTNSGKPRAGRADGDGHRRLLMTDPVQARGLVTGAWLHDP